MNIFTWLGNWLESRRVLRKPDLDVVLDVFKVSMAGVSENFRAVEMSISNLKEQGHIPASIQKEFALLNARLNRIELLVGLKRDPEAVKVPGSARIG